MVSLPGPRERGVALYIRVGDPCQFLLDIAVNRASGENGGVDWLELSWTSPDEAALLASASHARWRGLVTGECELTPSFYGYGVRVFRPR